jgi:hypothetical protein
MFFFGGFAMCDLNEKLYALFPKIFSVPAHAHPHSHICVGKVVLSEYAESHREVRVIFTFKRNGKVMNVGATRTAYGATAYMLEVSEYSGQWADALENGCNSEAWKESKPTWLWYAIATCDSVTIQIPEEAVHFVQDIWIPIAEDSVAYFEQKAAGLKQRAKDDLQERDRKYAMKLKKLLS